MIIDYWSNVLFSSGELCLICLYFNLHTLRYDCDLFVVCACLHCMNNGDVGH